MSSTVVARAWAIRPKHSATTIELIMKNLLIIFLKIVNLRNKSSHTKIQTTLNICYIITFIIVSPGIVIYLIKSKNEVLDRFKIFKGKAKTQIKKILKKFGMVKVVAILQMK